MSSKMPVVFLSHGSPMNALADNAWSRGWQALGTRVGTPRAVVAISAHWQTRGTQIQASAFPQTIHDFGGFPDELFAVQYPAPGDPVLAEQIRQSLPNAQVTTSWGLDHGTWSVLVHVFPGANVPVVQVSLDAQASPQELWELGQKLSYLRDEGILILGSGAFTHNLGDAVTRWQTGRTDTPEWASQFVEQATKAIQTRTRIDLFAVHQTPVGRKAHPTPEHWFPLLVAMGATSASDAMEILTDGYDMGSMSMRSILWG